MSFFLSEGQVISLQFLDLCVPTASVGPSSNDDGSRPADTAATASETQRLCSERTQFQKLRALFLFSSQILIISLKPIKSENNLDCSLSANVSSLIAHFYKEACLSPEWTQVCQRR